MVHRRRRLDSELIGRGLFKSSDQATRAINAGLVFVHGAPARNPGAMVSRTESLAVRTPREFVSRAGHKLEGALLDLKVEVEGRDCLDAGAGSGGFTDCLLKRGARSVLAVDVGYGQFDWTLRTDPRVRLMERTNIRSLNPETIGQTIDLVVADLSFMSLRSVAKHLAEFAGSNGSVVLMVKPQFEAERRDVQPGGVVTDPLVWRKAMEGVQQELQIHGLGVFGACASRLKGAEGNQEFFLGAARGRASRLSCIEDALGAAE